MSEPDFTNPTAGTSGHGSTSPLPRARRISNENEHTSHPGYTMDDMNPTERDQHCASNTNLACFWPVYVGNFKAAFPDKLGDTAKLYFASRGFHVRWCFHKTDAYYEEFQRKAGIYDMLVYFVSERDAKLAIEQCHRDSFRGYTLNVFPGRHPVYFDPNRSVHAQKMKSGRIFSEHFFEKHVKRFNVVVDCVVKFDMLNGALEFAKQKDVIVAQKKERMWTYLPVTGKMQKQRFLEQDLIQEIEQFLMRYPDTLETNLTDKYMNMLLQGRRPFLDDKVYRVVPLRRGPPKHVQQRRYIKKLQKRLKRKQRVDSIPTGPARNY